MKNTSLLISNAVAGLLVLGTVSGTAWSADNEKCYGVAKTGQNACNTNPAQHTCAGRAKGDNDASDFILVPQGSCVQLGGKLEPVVSKSKPAGK